jgi:hypothetical protein
MANHSLYGIQLAPEEPLNGRTEDSNLFISRSNLEALHNINFVQYKADDGNYVEIPAVDMIRLQRIMYKEDDEIATLLTGSTNMFGGKKKSKSKTKPKLKKTKKPKRLIRKGPNGGKYYINKGRKVYI